jgi:hypothetical protein
MQLIQQVLFLRALSCESEVEQTTFLSKIMDEPQFQLDSMIWGSGIVKLLAAERSLPLSLVGVTAKQ